MTLKSMKTDKYLTAKTPVKNQSKEDAAYTPKSKSIKPKQNGITVQKPVTAEEQTVHGM